MPEDPTSIDFYTVVYDVNGDGSNDPDEIVMILPESILTGFIQIVDLSTPEDYTIDETNKLITLTASGYQKGGTFISMIPADEEDN